MDRRTGTTVGLVMDVTAVVDPNRPVRLTGVERVTIDVLDALDDAADRPVTLCRFDRRMRRYVEVSRSEYVGCVQRLRASAGAAITAYGSGVAGEATVGRPRLRSWGRRLEERRPATGGVLKEVVSLLDSLGRVTRALASRLVALPSVVWSELAADRGSVGRCCSNEWGPGTVYCTLGLNAQWNDVEYLEQRREANGFAVVTMVHDLIGVTAPQYVVDAVEPHAAELRVADTLLVAAEATVDDLHAFAASIDGTLPPLVRLPMRTGLPDVEPVEPVLPPDVAESCAEGFVLCVGSVSTRKNHHLLLDVWERLVDELGDAAPSLVIVGVAGWLSGETMARIERTPEFRGVVRHLASVGDPELAWLYQQCRFTVYPSRSEGWGLPVTESLLFGKVCLAADATSLPEAGAGLAVLLDPIDREAWHEAILRCWTDAEVRGELETRIREHARQPEPTELARAVLEACETALGERNPSRSESARPRARSR